jgi:hypothetical protein
MTSPSPMTGPTPWHRIMVIGLLAVTTALVVAGCGGSTRTTARPSTGVADPVTYPLGVSPAQFAAEQVVRTSFLTVTTSQLVTKPGRQPGVVRISAYPVSTLQLRSLGDGHLIGPLLHSLGTISAGPTAAGTVIAVEAYGCRSDVVRIDPTTGQARLIRVLPQGATQATVSPNGRYLAYLTYPGAQLCRPVRQPLHPVREVVNPGGPAQFLPNVVAVVNLVTGATVRTATKNPGNPPFGLAWSPDGKMLATVDSADNSIALLSAARPDFATARQIKAPRGCGFVTTTWIRSGLVAVENCNRQEIDLSPRTLVELTPAGRPMATWRLAACIDGVTALSDPAARHVLVEEDLGYGNGSPCGQPGPGGWDTRIAEVRGSRLSTIANVAPGQGYPFLVGW